ncbi:hypothetical protein F5Y16DRAFT_418805 [Xylariaceae sp. FL0255]|nr:hypothetical protein F5Y16DRAFT_418805 [Xylariaceae sp. FL0255]
MSPTLAELERAAQDVIMIMKNVPELASQKVAVIGGLALWKYMPKGRSTEDVDFMISVDGPKSVKPKLLAMKNSRFVERAQYFYYKAAYFPPTAVAIKSIEPGTVPYISVDDLIVFKIFSCGLRSEVTKSKRDALDAYRLLDQRTATEGPMHLAKHQVDVVLPGLADVVKHTTQDDKWWKMRLGLGAGSSSPSSSKHGTTPSGPSSRGSGSRPSARKAR